MEDWVTGRMVQQEEEQLNGGVHASILESEGVEFLLSGERQVPLASTGGKTTCLFFSANWCRPCRGFMPHLVQLYDGLRASGKAFEVVFVSFDRDDRGFLDHYRDMPWLAVPFDAGVRKRLCSRLHVERIPSLIPLAPDGASAEEDAVELVEDYGVDAYPFGLKRREELQAMDVTKRHGGNLEELLGSAGRDYVISRDGAQVPIADLVGKTIGLYFGAHWCPPFRAFTARLVEAYNEIISTSTGGGFQVVFVSTDRNEDEFMSSLQQMPWPSVPFSDRTCRHDLSRIFDVKVIPTLVVLGPDGRALGTDGRALVSCYGAAAFPFTERRAAEVEAAARKEGEGLQSEVESPMHEHKLKLDMAEAYVCDACGRRGGYWVFSCARCNFDMHPSCCVAVTHIQHGLPAFFSRIHLRK